MYGVSAPHHLSAAWADADALRTKGQLAAARDLLEPVADVAAIRLGSDDPDVIETMRRLATVHRELGELASARRVLEEALEGAQLRLTEDDPVVLGISAELGAIADELGNRHEARRNFSRVARYGPGAFGPQHPYVRAAQRFLGVEPPPVPAPEEIRRPEPVPDVPGVYRPAEPAPVRPPAPDPPGIYRPEPRHEQVPEPVPGPEPEQRHGTWTPRHSAEPAQRSHAETAQRSHAEPAQRSHAEPAQRPTDGPAQGPMDEPAQWPTDGSPAGIPYGAGQAVAPGPRLEHSALPWYQKTEPEPVDPFPAYAPAHFGDDEERRDRSRTPLMILGVVALAALVAVVTIGLVVALRPHPPSTAGNSPSGGVSSGSTAPAAAPTNMNLRDNGQTIILTWTDPGGGTVPFFVEVGKPGGQLQLYATLPPGTSHYQLGGLNPTLDYCFDVIAVYANNVYGQSALVCTQRGTNSSPSPNR